MSDPAKSIARRLAALGRISEERGCLTRTFCSPAMRRANDLAARWMRQAGMQTRVDAVGNLIGHYPAAQRDAKILLLGSHLDTVRDAGKFDGALGVMLAVEIIAQLHRRKIRLPFAVEVVGFADEEGARYQMAYLGSRALTGDLKRADLRRRDADGITMAEAIRAFGGDPVRLKQAKVPAHRLLGYVETHIEQGPALEKKNLAVGVVSAISGQSRLHILFDGMAGHAGTTPMAWRRDALCAAAEFVLAVEQRARQTPGLVATVGQIRLKPGVANVIPGQASVTLDARHPRNAVRERACADLRRIVAQIASARRLRVTWRPIQETASVPCSAPLSNLLKCAVQRRQRVVLELPSGAGHDAAVMARITPVAMLFVRCNGGLSHHPSESVKTEDIAVAYAVMNDFLQFFTETHARL